MKAIQVTTTAILAVLLGIAVPASGQEQHGEEHSEQHEQQPRGHGQAKPSPQHAEQQHQPRQQHNQKEQQAQQQQRQNRNEQQQQQQNRNNEEHQAQQQQQARARRQPQRTQQQHRVEQSAWQQHRSHNWQSDHRTWRQRGGYHGYRIPDDRYRGYFGPSHGFRINGLPFLVVGGYPRFQYEGYWISTVDPWPEAWGSDWYDNDDVYVNYVDNGYYLYNRSYPGEGIAINITL
ncbi:MAG: hypothetical protein WA637_14375 [Terriglobales bacterium]